MKTAKEIRQGFKDFFEEKEHLIVSSAPMVVKDDPTLMFTNAGMNQFKEIFLGHAKAKSPRVANSQKCLRVSGKHNDLEEVGHDTYHHTMFEMLGNWSFGNYFKKEAIHWAWEFLVERMKIDPDRLYATVFEGDEEDGLERDNEAAGYWNQFLPENRIINGNKKDNFWEMGDTGPCGPCSEIHVDIRNDDERQKISGRELVNKDHPQVIEIWNLVFIQFNRMASGKLVSLPEKHVDTGMGFERLCMVLQGKQSNYDTDVFQSIIKAIGSMCNTSYGDDPKKDIAMRVIADHVRTIAFSIADGQLPSNNKAGYVIRRILRRAVRYGYTFLGFREPFMYNLTTVLNQAMGEAYPELIKNSDLISNVMHEEEESFLRTLDTGIRLLDSVIKEVKAKNETVVSGKNAFELYDTFGFPLDLTELILKENGLVVDRKAFDVEMQKQKERARNAAAIETDDWVIIKEDDREEFIGYDYLETDLYITRYRQVKSKNKTFYQLVFNVTPFYAESGGQVGDSGYIEAEGKKYSIIDTKKENNLIVHIVKELPENIEARFKATVNGKDRQLTANNHSATHLLHQALRMVLGEHVEQKGSLVCPDYLRFDFSHFHKVSDDEIRQVERIVNRNIRKNFKLEEFREIPINKAKEMGAMALFGEKYGDVVRAIKFGSSVELCGGTHVSATGEIGLLKITSESSISAGVRRIEAVTADKADEFVDNLADTLNNAKEILNNPPNLEKTLENLLAENNDLKKQLEAFKGDALKSVKGELKHKIVEQNGVKIIKSVVDKLDAGALRDLSFQLKGEFADLVCVLGTENDGKANLSVMISDDLVKSKGWHAGNIIREAAKSIQGGGGGQPFFATAGGKNPKGLEQALDKAIELLNI
ncbi:alanine--tRNA ligase [Saccharicrinis sp. FJH62]|uniref:alanine--tRNA ligase n=1 Tax=Saccharicrinis sp. FJH62 TaxID=3344657 RepID=UPI0035D4BEA1